MATSMRMCSMILRTLPAGIISPNSVRVTGNSVLFRRYGAETNSKATSEQPETSGVDAADAKASVPPDTKQLEALEEQNKKLLSQFEETQDKYRRALAETENVRQRLAKQIADAKLFGIQGFCKDLLDVADTLNRATDSVPAAELSAAGATSSLRTLHDGLRMTEQQLVKVFTRHGLEPIRPVEGDKFDPNFHEALFQQPAPPEAGGKAGTVAAVSKVGYKLHGRTLRPAVVGVFAKS